MRLPGSLIQEIHQPRFDRLVLHLFRGGEQFSLLVSLSPRFPRMHLLTGKLPNPPKPLRFASFLRAHVRGGRIERRQHRSAPTATRRDPGSGS